MNFQINRYLFVAGSRNAAIFHLKQFFDSRTYLRVANNRTPIFDAQFQSSIAEYQSYHNLITYLGVYFGVEKAVAYSQSSPHQVEIVSAGQPTLKKLFFGVAADDVCGNWDEVSAIIPTNKFIGWGYDYPRIPKVCFQYAWKQLKVMGHDLKSPGWGTSKAINPYIYQIYLTEDVGGLKNNELAQQFSKGVVYLKKAIKNKIPVMVGIDDAPDVITNKKTKKEEVHHVNTDRVSDHFVTIVGMGTDSKGKYFLFYDNATHVVNVATSSENRLYCDCDNFTIIGTPDSRNGYGSGLQYRVTQIRESK